MKEKLNKWTKILGWFNAGLLIVLTGTGLAVLTNAADENKKVLFDHIHGIGYTDNGEELVLAAHDGLRIYKNGSWIHPESPAHDYMGFSKVDDGFYSSGHPEPGSDLKNPLGIVKSTDRGQTLSRLDLYGEVDFHGMAAGFYSHAIYVFNPVKNSRMKEPGLYYTVDETDTWKRSNLQYLKGQAAAIAVHPSEKNVIAIGTSNGLFISSDFGNSFENLLPNQPITAVTFDFNGNLIAGGSDSFLTVINLDTRQDKKIPGPDLQDDQISFIAASPANHNELTIATHSNNVYVTDHAGEEWTIIAQKGKRIDHAHESE